MMRRLKETILEAGELARRYFNDLCSVTVTKKGSKDLVTEADIEIERFLRGALLAHFPDFGFLGEESGSVAGVGSRWIVDPIDGTHSFIHGQYFWSISVALETDGEIRLGGVYAPALNDLYLAERGEGAQKNGIPIAVSDQRSIEEAMVCTGFACLRSGLRENNLGRFCRVAKKTMDQRRYGSAALDLCMVADGQLDAFWEQQLNLFDVAAGSLIVSESGGEILDFSGKPGLNPKEVLATNGKITAAMVKLM